MSVEINLLRKPKKQGSTLRSALILTGLVIVLLNLLIVYYGVHLDQQAQELEEELQTLENESASIEEEIESLALGDHQLLFDAADALEEQVLPAWALLEKVVEMMPEEGYMVTFSYNYPTDLTMDFIYLDLVDVAYYLEALNRSEIVEEVTINTISGEAVEEEMLEEEDLAFWYEIYVPNYYTTYNITLDPEAVQAMTDAEEDAEEEVDDDE